MEPALPQDVELTCDLICVDRVVKLFVPGVVAIRRAVKR
jgi:hypothetical protein